MKLRWCLLLAIPFVAHAADKLSVAAAANLVFALESLTREFKATEPSTDVTVVTGASGNLVAQIQNGAPFDLFLSADVDYPEQLVRRGFADASSFTKFATGRLVLWTTRPRVDVTSTAAVVRDPNVRRIAIANPKTAPYGEAAREAMSKLGLWEAAKTKIVVGESISQTAQFVDTGNADAGFVAMSLVLSPRLKERGRWQEIDASLYSPLDHAAVITKRGVNNPAAARFLRFLGGAEARAILERFGYHMPSGP